MDNSLFERWLYESESDSLDFKRDQYKFHNATDEEKSELLKDIISMANSWSRVDAYIVIGIEDQAEKPNILHGISEHIDDASIQQFVNSKVSGVCNLEYSTHTKDDKTFGIIKIPVQKRPIYLPKKFGKLKKDTVYIRRGSSTDIAKPDEISKMGNDHFLPDTVANLEIGFYEKGKGIEIDDLKNVETSYFHIFGGIPKYSEDGYGLMSSMSISSSLVREEYYQDIVEYVNFHASYFPIQFAIINKGDKEASNIQVEIEVLSNDVQILLDGEEPKKPDKSILSSIESVHVPKYHSAYSVEKLTDKWLICNKLNCLHAKRTLDLDGTIYIQNRKSEVLVIKAKIFSDGQAEPYERELRVNNIHNFQELSWSGFYSRYKEQ